jgi:hypothetical protein
MVIDAVSQAASEAGKKQRKRKKAEDTQTAEHIQVKRRGSAHPRGG